MSICTLPGGRSDRFGRLLGIILVDGGFIPKAIVNQAGTRRSLGLGTDRTVPKLATRLPRIWCRNELLGYLRLE
jgi:hypothetical protein